MVVNKILLVAQRWGTSLSHFGKLSKEATLKSFLAREKRKLLLRLGERTLELARGGKLHSAELTRWVAQIDKIDQVLQRRDYGGENGRTFVEVQEHSKKEAKKSKRK